MVAVYAVGTSLPCSRVAHFFPSDPTRSSDPLAPGVDADLTLDTCPGMQVFTPHGLDTK